jgi:predicted DNA-binding transcriptional regulator AlpA
MSRNNRAALANSARKVKLEQHAAMPQVAPSSGRGKRLLSKAEVLERVGVSYPTLWAWMRAGKFPRGVFVGAKGGWFEDELDAWFANLPRQRLKGDEPVT